MTIEAGQAVFYRRGGSDARDGKPSSRHAAKLSGRHDMHDGGACCRRCCPLLTISVMRRQARTGLVQSGSAAMPSSERVLSLPAGTDMRWRASTAPGHPSWKRPATRMHGSWAGSEVTPRGSVRRRSASPMLERLSCRRWRSVMRPNCLVGRSTLDQKHSARRARF